MRDLYIELEKRLATCTSSQVGVLRAIEQAVDDEEVQQIWVGHTVEMAREFHANGVKSIYVSAPKGEAAELFLRQCVQEGIIAEQPAAQRSRI